MRGTTAAARQEGRATIGARWLTAAAVAGAALLGAPCAALALTAPEAISLVNARRAAHGIPAGVTHLEALSAGCASHNAYMALNGFTLTHAETPGLPGYTPIGAREGAAAASEVLARHGSWTATTTPWDVSPGHSYLLMAPAVRQAGYFESYGFQCMRMRSDPNAFLAGPPAFYSVPGNGRAGVPLSQTAQSQTGVPQALVGVPAGQATGPNILLYATGLGTGLKAVEASLTGSAGPVDVRVVDETVAGLYAGGGVMIPVRPLDPGAYSARVVWRTASGAAFAQQFAFSTVGSPAPASALPTASVVVPPPPAGTAGGHGGSPAKPDAPAAGPAPAPAPDPRLVPREQAEFTTPTLALGPPGARARRVAPALRKVRVARVGGKPAARLWLRRRATVVIRVETRSERLVRRLAGRKVARGVRSVVLGRLPGGRYRLVVTVRDGARGKTSTTRNFRLAGGRG